MYSVRSNGRLIALQTGTLMMHTGSARLHSSPAQANEGVQAFSFRSPRNCMLLVTYRPAPVPPAEIFDLMYCRVSSANLKFT